MTNPQTISPERAAELVRKGAVLIDIREADEHAREHIPGARHHALESASMPTVPPAPVTRCWYFIAAPALAPRAMPLGFLSHLRLARPTFLRVASTPGRRRDCRSRSTAASPSTSSGRCKSSPAVWCCRASCWRVGCARLLCTVRLCRCRTAIRWRQRFLRHGAAVGRDAVEPACA